MNDPIELYNQLRYFTGTENWYRHALNRNMLYTDGVKFFADNAANGAYWFLDIVATELFQLQANEPLQHIKLIVKGSSATIEVDDGDDSPPFYTREIEYTDCPQGTWRFYLTDNVLLLPSEY